MVITKYFKTKKAALTYARKHSDTMYVEDIKTRKRINFRKPIRVGGYHL